MSKSQRDADLYSQLAAKDTQPEPLKKVLAREQANYDCLSCRVMGEFSSSCCTHLISSLCLLALSSCSAFGFANMVTMIGASAFTALGAYTYWSGHRELRTREQEILRSGSKLTMAARRLGISGLSGMLIGLGLWRGFM